MTAGSPEPPGAHPACMHAGRAPRSWCPALPSTHHCRGRQHSVHFAYACSARSPESHNLGFAA
eukprot:5589523-Alexandrium_andersonii.AAC.1